LDPRRTPPDPQWPGGARVAVSFVINFEEGAEMSLSAGDSHNEKVYEVTDEVVGVPEAKVVDGIPGPGRAKFGCSVGQPAQRGRSDGDSGCRRGGRYPQHQARVALRPSITGQDDLTGILDDALIERPPNRPA